MSKGPAWTPERMGERLPWRMFAFLSQGIGFLLLFVGTIIAIIMAGVPPNCFNSTCTPGTTLQGMAWGAEISRLLWGIGLLGLGVGAGIQLQFLNPAPHGATDADARIYTARRRAEFVILLVAIIGLFLLMLYSWGVLPFPIM